MTRNAALAMIALAWGAAVAPAQDDNWANKLFKGTTGHDFGSVPKGAQLYHRFTMTNIYAVPLEITNVRTSCGCVTPTTSAQTLQPRETAYLDIKMDTRVFTGPRTVSVYVTVGPQFISTATLRVSANSRSDVVFNPGQISFGVVSRGETPSQSIDVEYAGTLDWKVSEVVKNGAPLDVSLEEVYRRPGQVGYRVRATLNRDAPAGQLKQELLLKTNDPASPLVPVLVEGTVQASLTVVPSPVSLGQPKVGETLTQRIVVRGARNFRVVGVDGLGEGLDVDIPTKAASIQILTLHVKPGKAGEFRRKLDIKTDLEKEGPVTVSVEGVVVP